MQKLLCLSLLALGVSSCGIQIKNTEICSVAGRVQFGGICAETLTTKTRDITYTQLIDMLEAQAEHTGPNGEKVPAHGAAIIMTSDDFGTIKTELEQACRLLRGKCTRKLKEALARLQ